METLSKRYKGSTVRKNKFTERKKKRNRKEFEREKEKKFPNQIIQTLQKENESRKGKKNVFVAIDCIELRWNF